MDDPWVFQLIRSQSFVFSVSFCYKCPDAGDFICVNDPGKQLAHSERVNMVKTSSQRSLKRPKTATAKEKHIQSEKMVLLVLKYTISSLSTHFLYRGQL